MTEQWSLYHKFLSYLNYITVEPTLYLYMMAFMTTTVLESAFFVDKACRVNHGFNSTICDDITNYPKFNKLVQVTASDFNFKNDIATYSGQIILAFFMGAWSDKRGRKMPLLIGLIGKLCYSLMVVVNSLQPTWPVEYIIYTAVIPMTFTGADVAIFAAAFTYLVDVSSPENRTLRVTLLEIIYLSTMPTGIALGAFLFKRVNRSYTIMFSINASLMVLSILYSYVRLKWRTTDKQSPLPGTKHLLSDYFDYNHVISTGVTIFKKRPTNKRTYLLMLIGMMALYTFQRDETKFSYLYLQLVFKWPLEKISTFRSCQSALQVVGLLTVMPILSKVFGWKDTIIVMIGAMAHTTARIFYVTSNSTWLYYIGGAFAAFGPMVAPVIRSMVSKLVAPSEKGKCFSVLSVADNAIPIISGVLFSKIYNATLHTFPSAFFYLTMVTQIGVFILALYIHFAAKDSSALIHEEDIQEIISTDENPSEVHY